ncbi:MAG: hypothetical protein K0R65_2777 [Crocinitomicaceae bacterium]|jgi:uncharacterized membrane protein YcaP (DUF421 family)|nr:hypothetical protein [Crocinitomicaceae bacterium]
MKDTEHLRPFDWERIFYQEDIPVSYWGEIALRTFIMFLVLIIALKFLSKRGVKQLSVFELAILIALGSATGDPMFYDYVPLVFGIIVIIVVILFYRMITSFTSKSDKIEVLLEGKAIRMIMDGRIDYENYRRVRLPDDKFFAELRLKSVDHLGQVRRAYLETSGEISIYFFEDSQVRPGLPIFPELLRNAVEQTETGKEYACIYCGNVEEAVPGKNCTVCGKHKWLEPVSDKRVK